MFKLKKVTRRKLKHFNLPEPGPASRAGTEKMNLKGGRAKQAVPVVLVTRNASDLQRPPCRTRAITQRVTSKFFIQR